MVTTVLPLLLFAVAAALLAGGLMAVGKLFGPTRNSPVKEMPYESGMDPIHDARRRFRVRFHLVAVAFLVFDVELLFLYPWAVASRNPEGIAAVATGGSALIAHRHLVFLGVMAFLMLLVLGLVYDWRKGLFKWR
jgi:NADH-quinone oxidoreductase subunit A